MRIAAAAAAFISLLAVAAGTASPAAAATGQCYDRFGRAVGPPFDTFYPPRRLIDAVIARGGNCVVAGDQGAPGAHGPYGPPPGHYADPGNDPGGRHADWCSTTPPSGYCSAPFQR